MKEGWLILDMVYSHGGESWKFSKHKPDYLEEVYVAGENNTYSYRPARAIRIMYREIEFLDGEPVDSTIFKVIEL